MKEVGFVCAFLCIFTLSYLAVNGNLIQLCQQIDYYKKFQWSIGCLEFADYGCYCGPGGWGNPADDVDNCCMNHDHCYDKAKVKFPRCYPYVEFYNHKNGSCFDQRDSCRRFVCDCDKALAQCLTDKRYHEKFINYRYSGHCKWSGNIRDLI